VIRKLREGEKILNESSDLTEVLRDLEISEATWNRGAASTGGMKASVQGHGSEPVHTAASPPPAGRMTPS